jgi:Arc/MetJ family transcription regulator
MYYRGMKFTLNIDDALLARVMESTGAKTKTEAIHAALAEIDRRNKLIALLSEEITMTPKEWENAIDESAWDAAEAETARVAEEPPRRDRKSRPRR